MADADRIALRYIEESAYGTTPLGVASQGTLTMDTQPTDTNTMTVGSKVYTFQDSLSDVDGNINIGGSLAQAKLNLVAAMNLTGTPGTDYALSMTIHPTVSAAAFVVDDCVMTAKTKGAAGDSIATTETFTAGTNVFDAATLGTTTAGVDAIFTDLRLTGESLGQSTDTTDSSEIRDDRQITDVVRTGARADGDINLEMSYGAYDRLKQAALQSAGWSTPVTDTQITFSMADGDNSINDSGSGFITAGFLAKQWILTTGFTTAANNRWWKIVSVAAGKIVLSGGTVTTEAAGASVKINMGAQILNGTTQPSFSIEKEYTDLTDVFAMLKGLTVNTMNLNVAAEQLITGSFGFLGDRSVSATETGNAGTGVAAPTNEIMSGVDGVSAILENLTEFDVNTFTLELTNNLRPRSIIGRLTPNSIGAGRIKISGSLQLYFSSSALIDKYLDFESTSLVLQLLDGDGNRYLVELPSVKFTDGKRVAGSQNSDIIADMPWSAKKDATEGITIRIVRIAA